MHGLNMQERSEYGNGYFLEALNNIIIARWPGSTYFYIISKFVDNLFIYFKTLLMIHIYHLSFCNFSDVQSILKNNFKSCSHYNCIFEIFFEPYNL